MKRSELIELINNLGCLTFNNEVVISNPVLLSPEMREQAIDYALNTEKFVMLMDADNFKKFKGLIGENKIAEHTITLDISQYQLRDNQGRQILSIKESHTKFIKNQQFAITTIEYSENNQIKKMHFISKKMPEIDHLLDKLKKNLPLECVEEKVKRFYRLSARPHDKSFWAKDWNESKYTAQYSDPKGIDSITVNTFNKYLHKHCRTGDDLILVDVGGGKGRVALKLIEEARRANIELKYILIEPDVPQCREAASSLGEKAVVFAGTLQDFIATTQDITSEQYDLLEKALRKIGVNINEVVGNSDLVISSGGPLNIQVVSYQIAHQNAQDFFRMIHAQGAVIATGLTMLLLSKKNLEKIGFKVENCVASKLSQAISESTTYHPAYVMMKDKS
ncbi:hypothetical protein [Legionella nagasakiensis]|uniref:hypothetical protein n=1 Tax=Legionella nagasakiensis TaxID=535290 RepID=UPI0010563B36|nr:hypothetical protein [Legionella nagasakiensis]